MLPWRACSGAGQSRAEQNALPLEGFTLASLMDAVPLENFTVANLWTLSRSKVSRWQTSWTVAMRWQCGGNAVAYYGGKPHYIGNLNGNHPRMFVRYKIYMRMLCH